MKLYDLRGDYQNENLVSVSEDPFEIFQRWFAEGEKSEVHSVNAMVLSTVSSSGQPSSRAVLLKAMEDRTFVFFTNLSSPKADDIRFNPKVCLHFYWKSLHRQVQVLGVAKQVSRAEAEAYFLSRPLESQISSWVSEQSRPISSRQDLLEKLDSFRKNMPTPLEVPPHWGGFCVSPQSIEFWQGTEHRLHHRVAFDIFDAKETTNAITPKLYHFMGKVLNP